MKNWLIAFTLLAAAGFADEIDDYIQKGKLSQAYDLLYENYKQATEAPEYIFVKGLAEESGENSASYLKDFINKSSANTYLIDWARSELGKYYLAQKLYVTARKHFEEISDSSPFGEESSYLAAKCYLLSDEHELAGDAFRNIVAEYGNSGYGSERNIRKQFKEWSWLGYADALTVQGDYTAAEQYYNALLNGSLEPPALIGLAELSEKKGNWENARRYLDTYQNRYASAGYGEIRRVEDEPSPTIAGTQQLIESDKAVKKGHYIQIGVFHEIANASRLTKLYQESGYNTRVENFIEGGEEFHRVMVGPYQSKQQAEFIKNRLEKAARERYLLIER
jgi:hypothetical protein